MNIKYTIKVQNSQFTAPTNVLFTGLEAEANAVFHIQHLLLYIKLVILALTLTEAFRDTLYIEQPHSPFGLEADNTIQREMEEVG